MKLVFVSALLFPMLVSAANSVKPEDSVLSLINGEIQQVGAFGGLYADESAYRENDDVIIPVVILWKEQTQKDHMGYAQNKCELVNGQNISAPVKVRLSDADGQVAYEQECK